MNKIKTLVTSEQMEKIKNMRRRRKYEWEKEEKSDDEEKNEIMCGLELLVYDLFI